MNLNGMIKPIRKCISLFSFLVIAAFSQTVQFTPDSTAMADFWHINSKTSLYVGASFYYMDPNDSIVVSFESSESDAIGELYCMIPGYADSAFYLFTNKSAGKRVNLTKELETTIPAGTEIFFMYKREGTLNDNRYTGRNRSGIDPENKISYPGASFVSRAFGKGRPAYGHRMAASGRINDSIGAYTDTIVFGFEDASIFRDSTVFADFDFNDVIFKVTGLNLNVEPFPDSLVLITSTEAARAGDTVFCTAQVWADSAGIKVRSSRFDSLITWKLEFNTGDDLHHDTLISSNDIPDTTALFLGRTAYKQFFLRASLKSPVTGETLSVRKPIPVVPGNPSQLSIELRADSGSSTFSFNNVIAVPRVQITSNMISQSLYALLRDKYGNFFDFSNSTKWDTTSYSAIPQLSSSVATVKNGNRNRGEGIIEKTGTGNVLVHASEVFNGDTLRDTVLVNVASVSYDSLRIKVIEAGSSVMRSSVVMTTDSCKEIVAEGKRIDTHKWEPISVFWSSDVWSKAIGIAAQPGIRFCPNDTGTGFVSIDYQGYVAKMPFRVNPGAPVRLMLFTDKNIPFGQDTSATAGKALILLARLFDKNGIMLNNPVSDLVTWKSVEQTPGVSENSSGYLSDSVGFSTNFFPLRAKHVVKLFSRFGPLVDSVNVNIFPGKPFRVVIESHADWQKTINAPDEIDTIEIPDDRTDATVYALVRDSIGNYIDSLREGTWGSIDSIVYTNTGIKPSIGSIRKNIQVQSGISKVFISNGLFTDTAIVRLLPYHYLALRITTQNSIPRDSLVISTNNDTLLYANALRSDTAIWKDVPVDWSIDGGLKINSVGSFFSQTFSVSPTRPGTGYITARTTGTNSLSDSIFMIFTRGVPTRAEFALLTPPEQLIAGDTIKAVVRIYNKDGLVPGSYCFSSDSASGASVFQDTLRFKATRPNTLVFSANKSSVVNSFPNNTAHISECFIDGVDTVGFLSFYAPFSSDSLHRFTVGLGSLTASTSSFKLRPSVLESLSIFHTHPCCPDTLVMRYPNDQVLLYTIGSDRFGNMRGGEPCNWHTTGTLHKFGSDDTLSRLIYGADSGVVSDDEAGLAIAISSENPTILDSLFVKILGPLSVPVSAITGDVNGNGLIDLIRIRFDMPVFRNSPLLDSRLNISYNSLKFIVNSTKLSSDSIFLDIYLKEMENQNLQTSWKPTVTLDNSKFLLGGAAEKISIETTDGVGPVIVTVRKDLGANNRRDDLVTVTFSEDIFGPDKNRVSLLELPAHVFETWFENPSGTFEKVKLLEDINNFNTPNSTDRLYFKTSNGSELTTQNHFSLKTDTSVYVIKDNAGNIPSVNNRKVRVKIYGTTDNSLVIAPNPSTPTSRRERPGEFNLRHNPYAYEWIKEDQGGTAISFQIVLPEKNASVGGRIIVLDFVGNTVVAEPLVDYKWINLIQEGAVVSNETRWGIIPSNWNANGTVYKYTLYWNGYTDDGVRAAPGIYKVVFKLFTRSNGKDNITVYKGFIGINK